MEIWKDIQGYEGMYQVSNLGRVKSCSRFQSKTERMLKQEITHKHKDNNEYGTSYRRVTLSKNNKVKRFQVHRLVAIHFLENKDNKEFVNHIDNDGSNNCVENLEWCTHSENMIHAQKQGRLFEAQSKGGQKGSKVNIERAINTHKENIGKKFNKWTMLSFRQTNGTNYRGLFRCECGLEKECNISTVVNGKSKGCHSCMIKESWKTTRRRKTKI